MKQRRDFTSSGQDGLELLATSHLEALDDEGRLRSDPRRGDVIVPRVPLC